jgi:pantoate kinase
MIRKKQPKKEILIDLTGPDGNAYALMGYARQFAKQLGLDSNKIINEMTSGDYENLLEVFDKNFGSFVILER